jgi:hypothetical protein
MRASEILAERFINGIWMGDKNAFSSKMVHETTPQAAEQIRSQGFWPSTNGIFFNVADANYSGGGYGGIHVICNISGPMQGILDLEDDENMPEDLDELAGGEEVATYARKNGYWAWTDGMQMSVLDPKHIQILSIEK